MFKKFMDNCKKPTGKFGSMVVGAMNMGHAPLCKWALKEVKIPANISLLDIGCGAGGNIVRIQKLHPTIKISGMDYSPLCVEKSKVYTSKHHVNSDIKYGDVMCMPYNDASFDMVTTFESIYFWTDPVKALVEIKRVLKNEGKALIVCEMTDPIKDKKWSSKYDDMKIYTTDELMKMAEVAGFKNIKKYERKDWGIIEAYK